MSPTTPEIDTPATRASRAVQKLQRAVVDGLEDVKGVDIVVFNTESLSPLFERVIVASGNSNRQTRALAASVVDQVREAGFTKPRIEGEDNGEWIVVDCGAVVAHIMQPAIRAYYRLEELWGAKPVRVRLGVAKPLATKTKAVDASKASAQGQKSSSKSSSRRAPSVTSASAPTSAHAAAKPARSQARTGAASAAQPARPGAAPVRRTRAGATSAAPRARSAAPRATKVRTVVVGAPAAGKPASKAVLKSVPARAPRSSTPR